MEEEKTTSETQKSDSRPDRSQLNAFENFYEKFRKVPLKYIDVFIGVCVAALVIVVLVGILKSKGILIKRRASHRNALWEARLLFYPVQGPGIPGRGLAEGSRPLLALQTLRENRRGGIHPSPTNRPGSRHHFLTIFFFFRTLYPKLPSFLPSAR